MCLGVRDSARARESRALGSRLATCTQGLSEFETY
jgi:hypothetical protein